MSGTGARPRPDGGVGCGRPPSTGVTCADGIRLGAGADAVRRLDGEGVRRVVREPVDDDRAGRSGRGLGAARIDRDDVTGDRARRRSAGAVKLTVARMSSATAVTPVGAPGAVAGVTEFETPGSPVPALVVAVTENVYAVPFVRPATVDRAGRRVDGDAAGARRDRVARDRVAAVEGRGLEADLRAARCRRPPSRRSAHPEAPADARSRRGTGRRTRRC